MAEGCRTFARVILGILSGLFLLIGLIMLGFGIALKVDPVGLFKIATKIWSDTSKVENGFADVTDAFGIFMIVLGCVTTVVSLLGFAGAISGSRPLLIIYAILVFLLLGAEIALIVVVAVNPKQLNGQLISNFTSQDVLFTQGKSVKPPNNYLGNFWFVIQNGFSCCGFSSSNDYASIDDNHRKANTQPDSDYNGRNILLRVPTSCCTKKINHNLMFTFNSTDDLENFENCYQNKTSVNREGCFIKIFLNAAVVPIAIAATTLGLQVLLIICAIVAAAVKSSVVI